MAIMQPEGFKSMKDINDPIGNQTRNLPACSTLPKPSAPPCTSCTYSND